MDYQEHSKSGLDNEMPKLELIPNQFGSRYMDTVIAEEFTSICLSGDSFVDIACNETLHPNGIPIRDLVGQEGLLFSFDPITETPVCRRFSDVRKTGKRKPLVRLHMVRLRKVIGGIEEHSCHLDLTPNHLVLVRVGWGKYQWIPAGLLISGQRLVADQRARDIIRATHRHTLVMEELLKRSLLPRELVHHLDHNHFNNEPSNLEVKSRSAHMSHHQRIRYGYDFLDPVLLLKEYELGENFYSLSRKYECDFSTIESRLGPLLSHRRTQAESLHLRHQVRLEGVQKESHALYNAGYTLRELASYYKVHGTTVSSWIKIDGGVIRTSLETKELRQGKELDPLNHRVLGIENIGTGDVFNMEVEGTSCFFANGVLVHNCPKTGQPDYGVITVTYIPNKHYIELKSLKFYLQAYRNVGIFYESLVNKILDDIVKAIAPVQITVQGEFSVRGGIRSIVRAERV